MELLPNLLAVPLNVRVILPEPLKLDLPDGSTETLKLRSYWITNAEEFHEIARAWDGGANVYFCPQAVKDKDHASTSTVTHMSALGLDLDFELAGRQFDPEELLERVHNLGLPPFTALVATGGGYQGFWIYDRPIYTGPRKRQPQQTRLRILERRASWHQETARKLCRFLAGFGADTKATDLPHLFRVPGFHSVKRGVRVALVNFDPTSRPSLGEISAEVSTALKKLDPETGRVAIRRSDPVARKAEAGNGRGAKAVA